MCVRFLTMKQLMEEDEEWFRPSEVVITKKNLTSTKRELLERIRELEAENADLKRQVTEAICYILSNEGASMSDCRTCFFVSSCERKPQQCEPDYEMCLRAVRKYIEDSGE